MNIKCKNVNTLSFLLHSLLDNGARMTPKRCSVFLLIFIVNCISKFNLIKNVLNVKINVLLWKFMNKVVCLHYSLPATTEQKGLFHNLTHTHTQMGRPRNTGAL